MMQVEAAKPRSCFLHVPKCAGSALTLYLRNVLGRRNVFHIGEGRYQKLPLEGLMNRYPIVTGHFNVAAIPEHLFRTTFFFTFLREPTDRIVSMYHFFKEGDLDSDRRAVIGEEWSLERALDKWVHPGRCSAWSNEQTFLFSGATDAGRSPEELLPLALRNLERFDFVGTYECFAEGVATLGKLRGWPLQAPVPRFKTSRKRLSVAEVERSVIERISDANRYDLALYHRAHELWEAARARAAALPAVLAIKLPEAAAELRVPTEATGAIFPEQPGMVEPGSAYGGLLPRVERGTQEIRFGSVDVFDLRTGGDAVVQQGNPTEIRLGIHSLVDARDIHVGLSIADETDMEVYGVSTRLRARPLALEADTVTTVRFGFDMDLAPGAYYLTVAIQGGGTHDEKLFHWIDNVSFFWCVDEREPAFTGLVDLRAGLKVGRPEPLGAPGWWRPPRRVLRLQRALVRKIGWPWRPPRLVRYVVRTLKSEGWGAFKYLLTGRVPPKSGHGP